MKKKEGKKPGAAGGGGGGGGVWGYPPFGQIPNYFPYANLL